MSHPIPFNRPAIVGGEFDRVREAIEGGQISGNGPFGRRVERMLGEELGQARVLLTTSCTHALEMAALLLGVAPGDEVVLPSYTFVSTANAFALRGARPVFVDVRPDTLNLDETKVEAAIGPRTKAIVPVHYAGIGCEMDALGEIAARRGVPIVEDNAHGLFASYRGRPLGTFGSLATQSFHETKNFSCGEGGALVVNDPAFVERAEILREKGTNRARFFRGQVDRYSWVDVGSSWVLSDLLAAFLLAQLEQKEKVMAARKRIWERYSEGLAAWACSNGVVLPTVPAECESSWHMFHLLLPDLARRQALIAHLGALGILAVFHYVPLHLSDMGRAAGWKPGDLPVTENVADRLLRLPLFNDLSEEDQGRVIEAVVGFRC
jgi:dTDP-4-amino-4,6-dideoxygalactose transaminase